ncbi:hypothetical protein ACWDRB_49625 [Nonomuraea sp. NPDC003707]
MGEVTVTERQPEPDRSAATGWSVVPDWSVVPVEELVAYRGSENRIRVSSAARAITGDPDPGAAIGRQEVALLGRGLPVRVTRLGRRHSPGPLVRHRLALDDRPSRRLSAEISGNDLRLLRLLAVRAAGLPCRL